MAKNIQHLVLLLIGCAIFSSCFHHIEHKVYHIEPSSHNGGLTVDLDWHDNLVVCSFSNDSIADGGYITFKRLLRDEFPIAIYYVAPDSIFIEENGKIIDFKSQGFNIFNVERVFELSNEYVTYKVTESGDTFLHCHPTYVITTPTDTLSVKRDSFINDYTYYINIHNADIIVWNANMETMKKR